MEATTGTAPELLAPAGDQLALRAAIENGADAVYFGLDVGFNARARAANMPLDELPEVMAELHRRGVKGYVTLNTLVFSAELEEAERIVREVTRAGVDAVLVQDLGLARLIREVSPELPIHASTQMTLTSSQTIAVAAELGICRVVLARECSLDDIRRIRRETSMPLEVFVHGALCVAYSGQCLTSESLGGRSANRGQCAQACRLPYELVCDGRVRDLGEQRFLLSPQDLAAWDLIGELVEAGVCAFKIEGRLKTPEYVANITRHYRQVLDAVLEGRPGRLSPAEVEEMELAFSRGLSHGWLEGCDHKRLVPATSSAKRGILVGHVQAVHGPRVLVALCGRAIQRGDGVAFECGRSPEDEQGGRIYDVRQGGRSVDGRVHQGVVELVLAAGAVDVRRVAAGMRVWKTDDPQLARRWRQTFTSATPLRRTPIDLVVEASAGHPLTVRATTATGITCYVRSDQPCAPALKHPLTETVLRQQFSRLGGTPFALRDVVLACPEPVMLPLSVLGRLRHALVHALTLQSEQVPVRPLAPQPVLPHFRARLSSALPFADAAAAARDAEPRLHLLCRSLEQLSAVLRTGQQRVYVDFADIRQYRQAVTMAHQQQAAIWLATPRIQKPDEMGIFHYLARQGADGILVRNLAALRFFCQRQVPCVADFSLNAANELTVEFLRAQGALRVTAAYDLNRDQLLDLIRAVPPIWLEVVIHQHMPMFHMEHCVFCAVLSPGTNKTNCGRPCDRHTVHLRDRLGMDHLLLADVGCRNTLFNATAQSAAEVVPQLLARGVRDFRVELLDESPSAVAKLVGLYGKLLAGQVAGSDVWRRLKAINRVGVTRGTLEERRHPLAIL
jgi:putative protease